MFSRPRRPLAIVLGAAVALLVGIAAFFPGLLGLGTVTGFVHLSAMRSLVTLCAAGVLVVGAVGLLRAGLRSFLAGFLVVGCVLSASSGGVLLARGMTPAAEAPAGTVAPVPAGTSAPVTAGAEAPNEDTLGVLTANVRIGNTGYDALLTGAAAAGADVIALQETTAVAVEDMLRRTGLGTDFVLAAAPEGHGTSIVDTVLLTRRELAAQPVDPETLPFASAGVRTPVGEIYAVHTHAPVSLALTQENWEYTVTAAGALCAPGSSRLVVGDFNATLDHRVLRQSTDCEDAARRLGMAGWGTWPATAPGSIGSWPGWLGTQIDHQFYDQESFRPIRGRILDIPASDHRAVLVEYRLP